MIDVKKCILLSMLQYSSFGVKFVACLDEDWFV